MRDIIQFVKVSLIILMDLKLGAEKIQIYVCLTLEKLQKPLAIIILK